MCKQCPALAGSPSSATLGITNISNSGVRMKYTKYVDFDDINALEFEIVSQELKVFLTRELQRKIKSDEFPENNIIHQNIFINKSRSLAGLPVHVLEGDLDGYFHPAENAWHNGEFQLMFRRLTTIQFVELMGDLIQEGYFEKNEINNYLERDNVSFRFATNDESELAVEVFPLDKIESTSTSEHPNIRVVVNRMNDAFKRDDYADVLHASAVIFEIMAKDIVKTPTVQNQTLKWFFDKYRQSSLLPKEILDFILSIYDSRSSEPLAAHGSTRTPEITKETAIVLSEMTRAFVKIEYTLHQEISVKP